MGRHFGGSPKSENPISQRGLNSKNIFEILGFLVWVISRSRENAECGVKVNQEAGITRFARPSALIPFLRCPPLHILNQELITFPSEKVPFSPKLFRCPQVVQRGNATRLRTAFPTRNSEQAGIFPFSLIEQFWQSEAENRDDSCRLAGLRRQMRDLQCGSYL